MLNYRPISLLSNLDKIIEKLMYNRIIQFLESKNIVYYKQFGFRKNFSTDYVIITLIENIQSAFDKKKLHVDFLLILKKHLIQLIITCY